MDQFLQLTLSGLTNGAVLALAALGFVLIYKASDVLNFAQGEFMLIGAYLTYSGIVQFQLHWAVALTMTLVVSAVLGLLVERIILRPMIGEPIISLIMVTIGLSSLLQALVGGLWGTRAYAFPAFIPSAPIQIAGATVTTDKLWAILIAALLFAGFSLFFRYSRHGIAMRAVADDQQVAMSMGISVKWVYALAWSIAAASAAVGGVLVANILGVSGNIAGLGLRVFPVVILGGLDSVPGAIVGGLIIGLLEAYTGGYAYQLNTWLEPLGLNVGGLHTVVPFIVLVIILMIRPNGLFGQQTIERM